MTLANDIYEAGYQAYFDDELCPYEYDTEFEQFSIWCNGHNDAYCEEEGK